MTRSTVRRVAAFALRHRWGFLTLATALFVWGGGALATPAPALVGGVLTAALALHLLALGRFGARRRVAFAVAERRRTHTSLGIYATSLLLLAFFLAGLFVAPSSTTLMGVPTLAVAAAPALAPAPAPAHLSAVAWRIPAMASLRSAAIDRFASKLPALYALGGPRPLVAARPDDRPAEAQPVLATRDDTLRILSFNVWHGYPGPGAREERYEHIRRLVEDTDPDIVLLQESWSTRKFGSLAERLSRDLELGYAYARANGSLRYLGFEEGLAILSRHPISEVRRLALGPRMPPWEMRAALGAVVALPGGDPIEVWNTHLSHSDAFAREGQARFLANALAGSRVAILAGDFNAVASSPAVGAFAEVDLAPVLSEGIDHVLLSPALRDRWTTVHTEARRFGDVPIPGTLVTRPEVSDHPALLVDLQRRAGAGAPLMASLPDAPTP